MSSKLWIRFQCVHVIISECVLFKNPPLPVWKCQGFMLHIIDQHIYQSMWRLLISPAQEGHKLVAKPSKVCSKIQKQTTGMSLQVLWYSNSCCDFEEFSYSCHSYCNGCFCPWHKSLIPIKACSLFLREFYLCLVKVCLCD